MKRAIFAGVAGALFFFASCTSDVPLELSFSQETVPADGRDTIMLEAMVAQGGNPIKDGTAVRFAIESSAAVTFT